MMWWLMIFAAGVMPAQALLDAQAQDGAIAAIAYRLQTRAVGLCADTRPQSGMLFHDLSEYPAGQRAAAKAVFGLDARPALLTVVSGSAADKAGFRVGDIITAIDGRAPGSALAADAALATAMKAQPAVLRIERHGAVLSISLSGAPGCASRVQVIPGTALNATADGTYVQLTPAVIAEARDDGEVASIIAHEVAHNILRHRAWLTKNGRSARNIRATEIEADRLSVHIVARAGYDSLAPARFWQRFGAKTGAGIFSDGTHLRTKARVALLETVAKDLASGKQFVVTQ